MNLRYGSGAACLFVLILGLLIFPAGPFIRPHPLVWRLAFGVGVLYEIWLILLMFQTKEQARSSMKFFDGKLGVPIEERSYAADCSFNLKTVSGAVDMFVVSHFIGWVVKALILRDMVICWVISIQWELIEILFMHMLPNFAGQLAYDAACDALNSMLVRSLCIPLPHLTLSSSSPAVFPSVSRMLVGSMDSRCCSGQRVGYLHWL